MGSNFGFRYRRAKESHGVNSEAGQNAVGHFAKAEPNPTEIRDQNCSLTFPVVIQTVPAA